LALRDIPFHAIIPTPGTPCRNHASEVNLPTSLTINGAAVSVEAPDNASLIDALRNHLRLTSVRFGCGAEQCGSCMVLIDGEPAYACGRELWSVAGRSVTTVEGLGTPESPHALQRALLEEQAGQCGYCLSGIMISAAALLAHNPRPSRAEVAAALDKHLCRCGTHVRILRAIERAAEARP
jgi:nicotinate dehydrogenase subunit A